MILIKYILYFPLLIRFWTSKEKVAIIDDLQVSQNDVNSAAVSTAFIKRIASDKYFRTIFYFRNQGIFSNVLRMFYHKERYFIIDINSTIGGGIKVAHPFGTILNAKSIGYNLYVNHLVTVGEKNGKRPIIGNNVELHANCTVIGGIVIGDNVIIGAGTVVTKNVPANTVIVGPANRILPN